MSRQFQIQVSENRESGGPDTTEQSANIARTPGNLARCDQLESGVVDTSLTGHTSPDLFRNPPTMSTKSTRTTVSVTPEVADELHDRRGRGDTLDDVIRRALDVESE
ncbi:hypothetical protein Halar_0009 (plasmid) [halophilic archaeon DL31]|nr:hypothetical protein Halar_0009 [halophilic archaeon DL31]